MVRECRRTRDDRPRRATSGRGRTGVPVGRGDHAKWHGRVPQSGGWRVELCHGAWYSSRCSSWDCARLVPSYRPDVALDNDTNKWRCRNQAGQLDLQRAGPGDWPKGRAVRGWLKVQHGGKWRTTESHGGAFPAGRAAAKAETASDRPYSVPAHAAA